MNIQELISKATSKENVPLTAGVLFVLGSLILLWASYILVYHPEQAYYQELNPLVSLHEEDYSDKSIYIDGLEIQKDDTAEYPFAVIMDNHPDARPQFGLSYARVVFNFPAEGSFTRILAFFQNVEDVEKIGPVRSARDYLLPFIQDFDADFIHSGGSPGALEILNNSDEIKNVEEISYLGNEYFWRDSRRRAPHNLFTSSEMLTDVREHLEYPTQEQDGYRWSFNPVLENSAQYNEVTNLEIDWMPRDHSDVRYEYDDRRQLYYRFIGDRPHVEAEDAQQFTAKNILIMSIPRVDIIDSVGRLNLTLTGSGSVTLYRNGLAIEGEWQRETLESTLVLLDRDGNQLSLDPGTVWVEVLPEDRLVVEE